MKTIVYCICLILIVQGCASSPKISTPEIPRLYPEELVGERKVLIMGFEKKGGECLTAEMKAYLEESGKFTVLIPTGLLNDREVEDLIEAQNVDLILSGEMEKYNADSDAGTRNLTTGYFTAFIITAPIAAGYAAASEWNGYAVACARMSVVDTSTDETIWSKREIVGINEKGKSLVSNSKIQETLLPLACKKLATEMLNDFLKDFALRD